MNSFEKRKYKKRNRWQEQDEECLFKVWKKYLQNDGRERIPCKALSKEMARNGFMFTSEEVKMKINNLISKYKREKKNHSNAWLHFDEIGEILKLRDAAELNQVSETVDGDPLNTDDGSRIDNSSDISIESEKRNGRVHCSSPINNGFVENVETVIKSENSYYDDTEDDRKSTIFDRPHSVSDASNEGMTNQEMMSSGNLYSVFDQIKTNTEKSLAEFKRATDLFEENSKVNRERNVLMKQYLNNSLDIQIEMLTLIRKMNNRFT